MRRSAAWIGPEIWSTARGFNTRCDPASNESNTRRTTGNRPRWRRGRPYLAIQVTLGGERGVYHVELAAVSTVKSNGPVWLIFTGITSRALATTRGLMVTMSPGQRVFAWLEIDVKAMAVAKRTRGNCRTMGISCQPPLAVRAEGDIGGYISYFNGLGVKSVSIEYGKDVDRPNCWRLLMWNKHLQA